MARLARAARVGDGERGMCSGGCKHCPHMRRGKINSGSGDVFIEGKSAARQGDSGDCHCPHGGHFTIVEGSSSVFINGKAAATVRDSTQCQKCGRRGTIIDGASTVFVGE